jgi:hypothetical protein
MFGKTIASRPVQRIEVNQKKMVAGFIGADPPAVHRKQMRGPHSLPSTPPSELVALASVICHVRVMSFSKCCGRQIVSVLVRITHHCEILELKG